MLTISEIRARLADRNLSEIARRLGVSRAHMSDIRKGRTTGSVQFLERLSAYLEAKDNG